MPYLKYPRDSFIAEVFFDAIIFFFLFTRCWILRHKDRRWADWVRDICFWGACALCLATTSTLAWYCWKMIGAYEDIGRLVDKKMAEAAKNSPIDITKLTTEERIALQERTRAQRETSIEGLTTLEMLKPAYRQLMFLCWAGYVTELWLLKAAFIAFYWRLFARIKSRFTYLLYGASILCMMTFITVITIHFAWCTPVSRNWTSSLQEFPKISSINSLTVLTIGTFLNVGTDLIILLLPLLILRSYNLKRREKVGLGFIFAVGVFCVIASIIRYVIMYKPYKDPPATLEGVRASFFWSTLEVVTGIVAFCLPSFRMVLWTFFKRQKQHVLQIRNRSHGDSGKSSKNMSDSKGSGSIGIEVDFGMKKGRGKPLPRHPNTLLTEDMVTLNTRGDITPPQEEHDRYTTPEPLFSNSPPPPPPPLSAAGRTSEESDTVSTVASFEALQQRRPRNPNRPPTQQRLRAPYDPNHPYRRPSQNSTWPENAIHVTNTISVTSSSSDVITPPPPSRPPPYGHSPLVGFDKDAAPFFNYTPPGHFEPSSQCTSDGPPQESEYPLLPVQKAYNPAVEGGRENLTPGSSVGFYAL